MTIRSISSISNVHNYVIKIEKYNDLRFAITYVTGSLGYSRSRDNSILKRRYQK